LAKALKFSSAGIPISPMQIVRNCNKKSVGLLEAIPIPISLTFEQLLSIQTDRRMHMTESEFLLGSCSCACQVAWKKQKRIGVTSVEKYSVPFP